MQEYSFVLAGRVGVGKSSIFHRLSYNEFLDADRAKRNTTTRPYDEGVEKYDYRTTVDGREVQVSGRLASLKCSQREGEGPSGGARLASWPGAVTYAFHPPHTLTCTSLLQ